MMGIHRLPDGLSRKIAAGEVIERPLSVVKELIENSLDAGATAIDVELEQGGKVLISVKDNGGGIVPEELPLAVEKHATSKISNEADLEAISTLGYRGEALSSVCAVSHFEIYSRRPDLPEGASLHYENGAPRVTAVPLRPGTTVVVKDLFYNLPARRKFLKTAAAEFRRISRLVQDYAFAYPAVAFSLTHDGKNVFKSSGDGGVEKLLARMWGDEPEIRASASETATSSVRLWWQDLGPQSRFQLISFVNGRRVSDAVIRSAIHGFHWATRGNWLVMLALPAEDVDVNVHPAKSEILFRRSGEVYDLVRKAADRLAKGFSDAPILGRVGRMPDSSPSFDAPAESFPAGGTTAQGGSAAWRRPPEREPHPFSRLEEPVFRAASPNAFAARGSQEASGERLPFSSYRQTAPASSSGETSAAESAAPDGKLYLAQLPQGYLVFSTPDGLLIVDPHAAHERVNYERILKACADPRGQEKLIMPIPLPPTLKDDAMANRGKLAELNFAIDEDGSLSRLPVHAKVVGVSPVDLLRSALNAIEERREHSDSLVNVFATKACKASVKLTTRLEAAEAYQLLAELERCDQPNACPHGRPTVLRLTGGALDRHFGRLGL